MEIRHLQTFKAIVEAGGFAKAANQLGYAQSTITSHIQALEIELEGPLFDRLGKAIALTELGYYENRKNYNWGIRIVNSLPPSYYHSGLQRKVSRCAFISTNGDM